MLGTLFGAAARRTLSASRDPRAVARLWRRTRALRRSAPACAAPAHGALPGGAAAGSPGVALLLRVLAWDHALYAALREAGDDDAAAAAAVERVNWSLARPGAVLAYRLVALAGGLPLVRVRRVVDALFAGLFGAPFARDVHDEPRAVAFDVTRCPLAEYLAARGTPELTPYAACALDYRMAAEWGVDLVRTRTIAGGAASCDFRFVPLERARGRGPVGRRG